ncbi:MAG TPA: Asp-tRNA(Asn)/Glu-tRNA(Gln) amidotransferase subunit GatC [Candidatus Nanoarchaeia archaeon]|nr:Asp-tRNA(Asn)/Glu-tRNA(Gln) amidotransferase subunit GatC [Candidatus Nanoarchaeia archaeon]
MAQTNQQKNNKNSLLGAIRRLKPAVLRSSLNREFLELKTVGLKSGVLNPPVFNKIIERETLLKVAKVARLNLSEEEIKEFLPQLNDVLDAFSKLRDFDEESGQATHAEMKIGIHPTEIIENVREDRVEKSFSQEEALSLTKHKKDGYFKGPRVV